MLQHGLSIIVHIPSHDARKLSRQGLVVAIWVRVFDTHWVSDLTGIGTEIIFYLWMASVLDLN
jgi:hypothetical protein